jgi:hypothetical protein
MIIPYLRLLFNIALEGSLSSSPNNKNKRFYLFKGVIEEELIRIQSFLSFPHKDSWDCCRLITLIICLIYKKSNLDVQICNNIERLHLMLNDDSDSFNDSVVIDNDYYGRNFMMEGFNICKWSRVAWNGLNDAEEILKNFKIEKVKKFIFILF